MELEIICLSGSPCSGKGTQSDLIIENKSEFEQYYGKNLVHVSTGDLFKKEIELGSILGKRILSYTKKGLLVPDEITIDVLNENLNENNSNTYLFDGFPRNLNQAKLVTENFDVLGVIFYNTSDEIVLDRLRDRINEAEKNNLSKRCDDDEETFKRRLKIFNKETKPGIDYLKQVYGDLFYSIDASSSISEIANRSNKALHAIFIKDMVNNIPEENYQKIICETAKKMGCDHKEALLEYAISQFKNTKKLSNEQLFKNTMYNLLNKYV